MSLWQWQELLDACGLKVDESGPLISGISIDSRSAQSGDLFIALSGDPGPRFNSSGASGRDGHDFVTDAVSRGANAAMVSKVVDCSQPCLMVEDTLDGLWQLGEFARKRMQGKVVAITGSSGKTTTRQWLEHLLRRQASTHASTGSLNNHWGVPLSLARMPELSEYGVFEIGTNHPGEIKALAELVNPDVAIVLNVLPAHIGNFGTLENIRREKLTISSGLKDQGIVIVPADLDISGINTDKVVTFGYAQGSDVCAEAVSESDVDYCEVNASVFGRKIAYRLSVGGEHRVITSLAVLAAVHCLGADVQTAAADFAELPVPKGRGNILSVSGIKIIDDSYNANPVSMSYALEALKKIPTGRKRVAIIGEMLELGDKSEAAHAEISALFKELDLVITVGEGFLKSPGEWQHVNTVEDLDIEKLVSVLDSGDVILVKGSNKLFWKSNFVENLRDRLESK